MQFNRVQFLGVLHSLDGKKEIRIEKHSDKPSEELGSKWANELLEYGGAELMAEIQLLHYNNG